MQWQGAEGSVGSAKAGGEWGCSAAEGLCKRQKGVAVVSRKGE
jgi:hypothetical protein